MTSQAGEIVHGIGVGPGDPELLTLRAARLIGEADLIAYPAPETGESFARRIAAPHLRKDVAEYAIRMNIGDASFPKAEIYDLAADRLAAAALSGQKVAILCEGDPFFYGSFLYLFQRLCERCRVAVVPGVSSLMACAAVAGQPLAAGGDTLAVIPAPLAVAELKERLIACDAAAIIKVGRHLGKVRGVLRELGLEHQARYVEHATLPDQKVTLLSDFLGDDAPYFSMLLVHKRGLAWRTAP